MPTAMFSVRSAPQVLFVRGEGGKIAAADLYDSFARQVAALREGGADAICVETHVVRAGSSTGHSRREAEHLFPSGDLYIHFQCRCQGLWTPRLVVNPEQAALAALDAGADVVGVELRQRIDQMIDFAKLIWVRQPIANPDPGNMQGSDFWRMASVYKETPEYMASRVPELVAAGANIIGGCCGTTPAHIAAIAAAVAKMKISQ